MVGGNVLYFLRHQPIQASEWRALARRAKVWMNFLDEYFATCFPFLATLWRTASQWGQKSASTSRYQSITWYIFSSLPRQVPSIMKSGENGKKVIAEPRLTRVSTHLAYASPATGATVQYSTIWLRLLWVQPVIFLYRSLTARYSLSTGKLLTQKHSHWRTSLLSILVGKSVRHCRLRKWMHLILPKEALKSQIF